MVKRQPRKVKIAIARQKKTIAHLVAIGPDAADAEKILKTFQQSQICHLMEMERILNVLHKLPPESDRRRAYGLSEVTGAWPRPVQPLRSTTQTFSKLFAS